MLTLACTEYYSAVFFVSRHLNGAPPEKELILLSGGIIFTMTGLYLIYKALGR